MVRSMFSGVAGMKAHQQRMDVIGNNIANVNTYGFKSSRATFRDMYYQNIRSAAAGTTTRGGVNPSAIGYGSTIASVDLLMTQSSMTPTGNPLDVCITGEGFIQVMDNDGNIFYTKAGMLDVDPTTGYLLDSNGYFVLGTQGVNNQIDGNPGNNKIRFEIDPVEPAAATVEKKVNNVDYVLSATNNVEAGNVSFDFSVDNQMPAGQDLSVVISGNNISVKLNPASTFMNMEDLMGKVNAAITEARGGIAHPAGDFSMTCDPNVFPAEGLTGAQLCESDKGPVGGKISLDNELIQKGFAIKSLGSEFGAAFTEDPPTISGLVVADDGGDPPTYSVTATIGGVTYSQTELTKEEIQSSAGVELRAQNSTDNDKFVLKLPKLSQFDGLNDPEADGGITDGQIDPDAPAATLGTATAQRPSNKQGLSGASFQLTGGTAGGPQSIMNLTGISIGADGIISANHSVHGEIVVGRIDLANFDNPKGLQQSGNSYFAATKNSGTVKYAAPGEDGTGALKNSALEMSNVDLSQEFSDMITTQRGFQANSRLITVSDTMLEELINLKR